jgi:hypothetical protein
LPAFSFVTRWPFIFNTIVKSGPMVPLTVFAAVAAAEPLPLASAAPATATRSFLRDEQTVHDELERAGGEAARVDPRPPKIGGVRPQV